MLNTGEIVEVQTAGKVYYGKVYGKHIELWDTNTGRYVTEVWQEDTKVLREITDHELFQMFVIQKGAVLKE